MVTTGALLIKLHKHREGNGGIHIIKNKDNLE
jgi:hypothetical protein